MKNYFVVIFICFLASCAEPFSKEIDSVQIGKQNWMKNNLNIVTFRNGDTIPEARTDKEWEQARFAEAPAWCHVKNNPSNDSIYGKLYNWYAVNDPKGLAPDGWHIPSDVEWLNGPS